MFGGYARISKNSQSELPLNELWMLNITTLTWTLIESTISASIPARGIAAGAIVGDTFYIGSGMPELKFDYAFGNIWRTCFQDTWAFNTTTSTWLLINSNNVMFSNSPALFVVTNEGTQLMALYYYQLVITNLATFNVTSQSWNVLPINSLGEVPLGDIDCGNLNHLILT